jgi:uncharacterized membrane-anchored protein YitT (DUF2179 family)
MNIKQFIVDFILVLIGCILLAFAVTAILEPNNLITGGFTGLSLILDDLININYTYIYYVFSLLVLAATYIFLGKHEARKILLLSIVFPSVLVVFNWLDLKFIEDDLFLASIYYGIIGGVGVGLILRQGYSTGGTDSVGKIIHVRKYPFISINQIITMIDLVIILISIWAYNLQIALYGIITQLVLLKAIESVMYGLSPKLVKLEIISNAQEEIAEFILYEIKRGISKYVILGGFTNQEKIKIVTVCSPRESLMIRNKLADLDENAFADVLPVISVWGEGLGFKRIRE